MNDFYLRMMRAGARLIFWIAIILLTIQLVDDIMALALAAQMVAQPYGPQISLFNMVPKLIEAFTWPALLLAMSMIVDRLDALISRGSVRQ